MDEDQSLLCAYSGSGDERAFGQLVERYSGLVYSVAVRTLEDPDLAKDATQMVFSILARKASELSRKSGTLTGWLHRVALFEAKNLAKKERNHQRQMIAYSNQKQAERTTVEAEAADHGVFVALHAALNTLSTSDRSAVVMRFFNGLSFSEIGERLNKSDDASQKQVSRALQMLQRTLARRGTTLSLAALGGLCSSEFAKAAPAGLSTGITSGALAGAATLTKTQLLTHSLTMLVNTKQAIFSTISAIALGIGVLLLFLMAEPAKSQDNSLGEGLISYWQFEEDFRDSFGFADGQAVGEEPIAFGAGKFGNGIELNGDGQLVVIDLETEEYFDIAVDSPMTISAWFIGEDVRRANLLAKGAAGSLDIKGTSQGTLKASTGFGDSTNLQKAIVDDGEIHHVVVVVDPDFVTILSEDIPPFVGRTRVFIDGVLDTTEIHRMPLRENRANPLVIGGGAIVDGTGENTTIIPLPNTFWVGMIDDVAIWKRALRDDEIAAVWNGGDGMEVATRIDFGLARIGGPTSTPYGIEYRFRNGESSTVDQDSIWLEFNGEQVDVSLRTEGDEIVVTHFAEVAPEAWSTATYSITARDSLGNLLADSGSVFIPQAELPLPGEELPGPSGQEGAWGIFQVDKSKAEGSTVPIANVGGAISLLRFARDAADFLGEKVPGFSPTLNFSNDPDRDAGLFSGDSDLPSRGQITEHDFVILGKASFEHAGGPLTLGVHSNEGFALRLTGASFDRAAGGGRIDDTLRNILLFEDATNDSNTRGIIEDLAAGVYGLEFISWNEDPPDDNAPYFFFEVYSASGTFEDDDDTDTWRLIGAPDGLKLVSSGDFELPTTSQLDVSFDVLSFVVIDTPGVQLQPASIALSIGEESVQPTINKSGSNTVIAFMPDEPFPPGFTGDWVLSYLDQNGTKRELSGQIALPSPRFPLEGFESPRGQSGRWGLRVIRDGALLELDDAITRALAPEGLPVFDSTTPIINFTQPTWMDSQGNEVDPPEIFDKGVFADDVALPGTPVENVDNGILAVIAHAFVEVPVDDDYTLGIVGGDGFAIRFKGHPLTPFALGDPGAADTFPEYYSDRSLGGGIPQGRYLRGLKAGIYEIEFIGWGGDREIPSFEIFTSPGIVFVQEANDSTLIGGEGGWRLVNDPKDTALKFLRIEVERDPITVGLTFRSRPDESYRVFRSIDLRGFTEIADGIASDGSVTSFQDDSPVSGAAYYRLERE